MGKKAKKNIIEVIVGSYTNSISYRGKFYMRSGATNMELNNEDLMQMLQKSGNVYFESIIDDNFSFKDINLRLKFLRKKQ